jgi:uncharacterized protein
VRLIPRDEHFFEMFGELAQRITSAARLLIELFSQPERTAELVAKIKDLEHEADNITRDIVKRINTSFVTPIDREDIHLLASKLDSVIDLIDGASRRAQMFHVNHSRPAAGKLAEILVKGGESIERAVVNVKKPKIVAEETRLIKQLEEEGDAVYHEAIGELFSNPTDPIEVIKWKDLLERVEDAIDHCEDVANVLEAISLKHL